uniref:ATP synthase subunit delta, chloroplastic n=1 Tax=Polysiphonia sertularioides TaxID=945028 RepID=A0A1Z1MG66_9FLOR|nr:ATP synthase CF1 subunit delta [Polysiphonia sertularioides]
MSNQNLEEKVALPYADALISYAQSLNVLKKCSQELSLVSRILSESEELKAFLLNPLTARLVKKEVLKDIFSNEVEEFIMNFLFILVDRRRIAFLNTIINKYFDLVYSLESVSIAELYSAVDLSETQQESLIDKIKALTASKEIKLICKKDSSLIGGFIIKIGSKVIDSSIAGKLNKMSLYLSRN